MMSSLDLESSSTVDNNQLAVNTGGGSADTTVCAAPLSVGPPLLNAVSYQGESSTTTSNNQKIETVIIMKGEEECEETCMEQGKLLLEMVILAS